MVQRNRSEKGSVAAGIKPSAQALRGTSSYDQAVGGRSGTKPRSFLATSDSPKFFALPSAHVQAYGIFRSRGIPRRIGMTVALLGSDRRIADSCCLVQSSFWCAPCTIPASVGAAHGNHAPSEITRRVCTLLSTAICSPVQASDQSACRIGGSYAHRPMSEDASFGASPCIDQSSTLHEGGSRSTQRRTQRISACTTYSI